MTTLAYAAQDASTPLDTLPHDDVLINLGNDLSVAGGA